MNSHSVYNWWHCTGDTDKPAMIDALCRHGHVEGKRVAVLAAPEQLISNLSVRENIELQCAWECREKSLEQPVLDCLRRGFRAGTTIEDILSRQGSRLSSTERRWLGLARALHSEANWLVIEDDEKNLDILHEDRLQAITQYFPALTLHWVSLHKPVTLPDGWILGDPGELA